MCRHRLVSFTVNISLIHISTKEKEAKRKLTVITVFIINNQSANLKGSPLKAYADGWQLETGLQAYRSGGPVRVLQLPSIPSGGKLSNARTGIQGKKKYYKQSGKQNQLITSLFNRMVQFQGRSITMQNNERCYWHT